MRDGRAIYIGAERVADVTAHPASVNRLLNYVEVPEIGGNKSSLTNPASNLKSRLLKREPPPSVSAISALGRARRAAHRRTD